MIILVNGQYSFQASYSFLLFVCICHFLVLRHVGVGGCASGVNVGPVQSVSIPSSVLDQKLQGSGLSDAFFGVFAPMPMCLEVIENYWY